MNVNVSQSHNWDIIAVYLLIHHVQNRIKKKTVMEHIEKNL